MALALNHKYQDVYTLEDYQIRISEIEEDFAVIRSSNFLDEGKQLLQQQVRQAQENEKKIFKILNVTNIDDLNKRLNDYRKAIINFSGPRLYEEILAVLEEENAQKAFAFRDAVLDIVNTEIVPSIPSDPTIENIQQAVLKFLNKGRNKKTLFTSIRGMKDEIRPLSFTKEQQNKWKQLLADNLEWRTKHKSVQDYINIVTNNSANNTSLFFNWNNVTNLWTPEEAKQQPYEVIKDINQKIKDKILSLVPTNEEDRILIGKIIDHILSKNFYEFFVGKNIDAIIGTFGEMSGLYYVAKFLGGDLSKAVQWSGGKIDSITKKKPHQDIILQDIFGIQVKNTKSEEIANISFSDIKLDTALKRIAEYGLEDISEFVQLVYGTFTFNIKYQHTKKGSDKKDPFEAAIPDFAKPLTPGQKEFSEQRAKLSEYVKQVGQLLSVFASTFMFLDVYDKSKYLDLNSLFLLGIDSVQTASNILQTIIDDLSKDAAIQTTSFTVSPESSSNVTIVNALNSKNRSPNFSENSVLPSIVFRSSFNFSL